MKIVRSAVAAVRTVQTVTNKVREIHSKCDICKTPSHSLWPTTMGNLCPTCKACY